MGTLFKNVRLQDDTDLVDIRIDGETIAEIASGIDSTGHDVIEGDGRVVLPGLVEAHIHLDKALVADRCLNRSGTVKEAIAVTAELKPTFTSEDVRERAEKTLRMEILNGVTHMRTQSEFDPAGGFTGFHDIMALKERYKNYIDMQVVAFPQEGIHKAPGTEQMMYEAMDMGADIVGGVPYNDFSANDHIDTVFEIAKKYDKPIDFHQDFMDNAEGTSIQYVIDKTIAEGFQGRVAVGHLTSLGAFEPEALKPIAEGMAQAGISVFSLPATDLHLGGRGDTHNVRRALTPIRFLRSHGVNVSLASNNIRNAFTPYGNGDLFQIALLGIAGGHLGGADDLPHVIDMITTCPADALGYGDAYGVEVGKPADLIMVDSRKRADAIIDLATKLIVMKRGKVLVRTTKETEWFI
ncbi:MAG: amidohydrolase family protein [Thermomicrobiales bacterium]|nr:amidohydrolase family protein [Thermomicrobiales bacterium]